MHESGLLNPINQRFYEKILPKQKQINIYCGNNRNILKGKYTKQQ